LDAGARRRVPGLRREELATLAGISSAYYLRLELGRDTHPSAQVVDALARALQLDPRATEYLYQLVFDAGWPQILAPAHCHPASHPGQNFLRWRLLEPAARKLYVNWDEATEIAVSGLREVAGSDMGDPRLRALIDELTAASQRFRELWARADVGYRKSIIHMRHPQVGDLHLHRNRLVAPHSGGQHLLIYYAEPGSESAKAPEVLRGLPVTVTAEVEEELTRAPR
jgi:transcriptional regulator with XRE-family HTH domain